MQISFELRVKISQVCGSLDVDGLRGDIVTNRAAKAYAAYNGRDEVTIEDIEKIIVLCLRHRLRKDPLESIDSGDKVNNIFDELYANNAWTYRYYSEGYDPRADDPYTNLNSDNSYSMSSYFPQAGRNYMLSLNIGL